MPSARTCTCSGPHRDPVRNTAEREPRDRLDRRRALGRGCAHDAAWTAPVEKLDRVVRTKAPWIVAKLRRRSDLPQPRPANSSAARRSFTSAGTIASGRAGLTGDRPAHAGAPLASDRDSEYDRVAAPTRLLTRCAPPLVSPAREDAPAAARRRLGEEAPRARPSGADP
jgi:hypothetical protein